jgi:light-regulated signal transduction histidine kinase (bacteriophytochrome)
MYDLINSLLLYSRIQTKGRIFDKVDMNTVLQKVMDNLSLIIKETNAVINCNDLPVIFGDENQMIELLQNLIENSIKFSIDTPDVTVSARLEDENYVFSVKDRGIGIDPIYSEKIFRIFQRLHGRNEYEGTGIGLAICKRIVERHGGRIWLQSELSNGSTFCFSIPGRI